MIDIAYCERKINRHNTLMLLCIPLPTVNKIIFYGMAPRGVSQPPTASLVYHRIRHWTELLVRARWPSAVSARARVYTHWYGLRRTARCFRSLPYAASWSTDHSRFDSSKVLRVANGLRAHFSRDTPRQARQYRSRTCCAHATSRIRVLSYPGTSWPEITQFLRSHCANDFEQPFLTCGAPRSRVNWIERVAVTPAAKRFQHTFSDVGARKMLGSAARVGTRNGVYRARLFCRREYAIEKVAATISASSWTI